MPANPHEDLPLPEEATLETLQKVALSLWRAAEAGDAGALAKLKQDGVSLSNARFVTARAYGFQNWAKFARHLKTRARLSSVSRFEDAADAVVAGDIETLRELLLADHKLAQTRSTRSHGATLLNYTAANGVENARQKTPANIVKIAELLLSAGADVNATAALYGSACGTLELAATSGHPVRAGVQLELLRTLLEHGASVEKPGLIRACLANGRPAAAEFLAAHGAAIDFIAAAGLGRLEDAVRLFDGASAEQKNEALFWASEYGRDAVVEYLVANGADLSAHRVDGQTALHWAVIGGQVSTVRLLMRLGASLEATNRYGGTPLGQAQWSTANGGDAGVYREIVSILQGE
jgi:hypothetical protein